MSEHFGDRLVDRIELTRSYLTVGLDPDLRQLPAELLDGVHDLSGAAQAALRFCRAIVDGVADIVPVVKPQSAFFEQFGSAGLSALEELVAYAHDADLLVLEDAKRGDIGSTMAAYATALLGRLRIAEREIPVQDVDAVTVNSYLGPQALEPMVEVADRWGKGLFVLVRTSNPGSAEVQLLATDDGPVFERVARFVDRLARERIGARGYSSVGAVAGLTYPADARKLRALMPHSPLLVPGLGAQGGSAADFPVFLNPDGLGAIVAASRAVAAGWREVADGSAVETRVRTGARAAAKRLMVDLGAALEQADRWRW